MNITFSHSAFASIPDEYVFVMYLYTNTLNIIIGEDRFAPPLVVPHEYRAQFHLVDGRANATRIRWFEGINSSALGGKS